MSLREPEPASPAGPVGDAGAIRSEFEAAPQPASPNAPAESVSEQLSHLLADLDNERMRSEATAAKLDSTLELAQANEMRALRAEAELETLQETHRTLQETHRTLQETHRTLQETHRTLQDRGVFAAESARSSTTKSTFRFERLAIPTVSILALACTCLFLLSERELEPPALPPDACESFASLGDSFCGPPVTSGGFRAASLAARARGMQLIAHAANASLLLAASAGNLTRAFTKDNLRSAAISLSHGGATAGARSLEAVVELGSAAARTALSLGSALRFSEQVLAEAVYDSSALASAAASRVRAAAAFFVAMASGAASAASASVRLVLLPAAGSLATACASVSSAAGAVLSAVLVGASVLAEESRGVAGAAGRSLLDAAKKQGTRILPLLREWGSATRLSAQALTGHARQAVPLARSSAVRASETARDAIARLWGSPTSTPPSGPETTPEATWWSS